MKHKLQICESCSNIISIKQNKKLVFVCPVCGALNERVFPKDAYGHLEVVSPTLKCRILIEEEQGSVVIKDVDEDLEFALSILTKYGFRILFKKERDAEEED